MTALKYVILDEMFPVVFSAPLQHKDMLKLGEVTSAGYFVRDGEDVLIVGEAISIPVKNGKRDQALLERFHKEGLYGGS
jgi:hypothetical protein